MTFYREPLVSVCIPAYNSEEYIAQTIQSILNQTYQNIELVICDDCSKDNTVQAIREFDDSRIHLIINDKNLGMSGNWNNCLNHCNGEFIKLICADDTLDERAIEKEVMVLILHPKAVMSESDTCFRDPEGNTKGHYRRYFKSGMVSGKEVARASIFSKNMFGAPLNNTFRATVLQSVPGFDPMFTYILDYDFFMSVAEIGNIYIIHEDLNYFRLRQDSNTGRVLGDKHNEYVNEHMQLLDKHRDFLGINSLGRELSGAIRKGLIFGSQIYLKMFLHSKQ